MRTEPLFTAELWARFSDTTVDRVLHEVRLGFHDEAVPAEPGAYAVTLRAVPAAFADLLTVPYATRFLWLQGAAPWWRWVSLLWCRWVWLCPPENLQEESEAEQSVS